MDSILWSISALPQTSNSQLPFIRSCTWERQRTLSLGIWPGHKLHILKKKSSAVKKELHSNHCFNRHKLAAKANRHFSHMAGGKNNLKKQMEILPEEHIKTQASQESQTESFVLNLWRLTQLKSAERKNNLHVLSLWVPLQDPGAWLCFHRGIIPLT